MEHLTTEALEAGLDHIRRSPSDHGRLEMIVRRPAVDVREALPEGVLDTEVGLVGDTWSERSSTSSVDGGPHPEKQLNVINARLAALVAVTEERQPLAGDQLYLDLDLSISNLPPGTRLAIGEAVIEITEPPHRGCQKFSSRFGLDALRFVNSPVGRDMRLRGACARVITGGVICVGDEVRKLPSA